MFQKIYRLFLAPVAKTEDDRRREFILDILLIGSLFLSLALLLVATVNTIIEHGSYIGVSPVTVFIISAVFGALYFASRRGHYRQVAYVFITIFLVFSAYPLAVWGILLPEGILAFSLVIVMAGVLLSSRAAFIVTALMACGLVMIVDLEHAGNLSLDMSWTKRPGDYTDAFVYIATFTLIALVSWLSNREIGRSLMRARRSERELRKERNSLEVKVQERTKELQQSQVERVLQLQRFAEFGRLTSTLLHDLANPLTSVSIDLEQLADTTQSQLVNEARKGIASMERYLNAARLQLRNQSEVRLFNVAEEVSHVRNFMESKAKNEQVQLVVQADEKLELYGDITRFNQFMANLIANAIDAYDDPDKKPPKRVVIGVKAGRGTVIITVEDFAVGIDKEVLPHIFESFYSTKSADRGTGLGLSISKSAIEEDFDGTISATSTKGRGTCFTVKLPTK